MRAFEVVFPPLDLCRRTAPSLPVEHWPVTLREFAVEACVVRNDDHGVVCERRDSCFVDPLPGDHLVCDASECGDLQRDWLGRFIKR